MEIELKIRDLLLEGKDLSSIAESLLEISASSKAKQHHIAKITNFLIHAGLYQEAFRQFSRRFYEKEKIPWAEFIEILDIHQISPSQEVVDALIEGAKESDEVKSLVNSFAWDKYSPQLIALRSELLEKTIQSIEDKKTHLIQKIEFLKNQRLIDEEHKAYSKFFEMFPDNQEVDEQHKEFKERWARQIISNKVASKNNSADFQSYENVNLSDEDLKLCKEITKACSKLIKNNKELAYNLAIMLFNLEYYDGALKVLKKSEKGVRENWLQAEILFEAKKYFEVLKVLDEIQKINKDDPDTDFAVTYLKAKTFCKLGHEKRGLDLLREIIEVRPRYRSAQSLIAEWSRGA